MYIEICLVRRESRKLEFGRFMNINPYYLNRNIYISTCRRKTVEINTFNYLPNEQAIGLISAILVSSFFFRIPQKLQFFNC